jgi:hypothetical protein
MKRILYSLLLILAAISLSAQDKVHLLAGYHYEGKILSETENRVNIRRNDNTTASISKLDIWKIVYENGNEVILNEPLEEIESRIGKIDRKEALEEIIREGEDREAEVAYYFLIRNGYSYEFREKNIDEFLERFPDSRYRRELQSMTRFSKRLRESAEIRFECIKPFTPEVIERKTDIKIQFTDQQGASRTLEINVILNFTRTYGKKYILNDAREWKNEYEISFLLDDSPEPLVLSDIYKLMGEQGDSPHRMFLSNVTLGEVNLNGQIEIGTHIREEDGEYIINFDILVDYQKW